MSRPPYRPPSRANRRVAIAFLAIIAGMATVAYSVAFFPRDDDKDSSPTATAETIVPVGVTAPISTPEPETPRPTVAVEVNSPPAETDPEFAAACPSLCLVRLNLDRGTNAALSARGLRPAFEAGEHAWAGLSSADIKALRADGVRVAVVSESAATLDLYAVRTPGGPDDASVATFGETVDRIGNQYIVRVPTVPPAVRALTDVGIWIEKFPPLPPSQIEDRRNVEPLAESQLGALSNVVTVDELWATMTDLQGMDATDGSQVGSRYYALPGNVMAAEYLYRRFEAYGLKVWYEDFIADNGTLVLNVVAELPGRDPSKGYLVLGHYDTTNAAKEYDLAPGADDNATGIAGMLEIARVLSGYGLEHPVRFFATNGEEVGLQGVQAFASRANREGTQISGAFNLDAIGSPIHGSQIIVNGDDGSAWLRDILERVNDAYGLGQAIVAPERPKEIVSDDTVLRDWGFSAVLIARELFGWSSIHHTPQDVVEGIDVYNLKMATELALLAVASLVAT